MRTTLRDEEPRHASWNVAAEQTHTTEEELERAKAHAALEDYLDHACLPLVETLSYADRMEMRRELTPHLQALAAAFEELGDPPGLAMKKALEKFGPPEMVSRLWKPAVRATPISRGEQARRWLRRQWPGIAATLTACSLIATAFAFLRPLPTTPTVQAPSQVSQPEFTPLPPFQHSFAVQHMACTDCHRSTSTVAESIQRTNQLRALNAQLAAQQAQLDLQLAVEQARAEQQAVQAVQRKLEQELSKRNPK